jgi:hypothetical protein
VAFALASGFLVFGDRPDPLAWSGITLIVGSGFYTYHRERLRGGSSIDPVVARLLVLLAGQTDGCDRRLSFCALAD